MGFNSGFKGLILVPTIRTLSIYASNDVRIRGYFSKQEEVLGDTSPKYVMNISLKSGLCNTDSCFILIIKQTRCTNFSNLFWNRTLHISDRFTVHHQESSTVYTAIGICHKRYADCLLAGSGWNIKNKETMARDVLQCKRKKKQTNKQNKIIIIA